MPFPSYCHIRGISSLYPLSAPNLDDGHEDSSSSFGHSQHDPGIAIVVAAPPDPDLEVLVIVDPRLCEDCGEAFDPPIPKWAPYGLLFLAIILFLGALGVLVGVIATLLSEERRVIRVGQFFLFVVFLGVVGWKVLIKSLNMLRGRDTENKIISTEKPG